MVIDTSALIAVLWDEPERRRINEVIEASDSRLLSAATLVEASIVQGARHGPAGTRELDLLIREAEVEVIPVDDIQAYAARDAFATFGRGVHPAGLNFGDCFSYALALTAGHALVFKGEDFARTD